ncbi:alpha/beta hydrolase [Streptomyces sp. NPDC051985]|uniref:alpha/beta hydrolase n=1 Tax=Streptomyces sp. NPDC051985 TaxID=3155807 RepID=UPI0034314044
MADPIRVSVPSAGGVTLASYRWAPVGEPKGIVQIAHGMGEHALCYQDVADVLVAAGYVVYSHDHRGHGATLREGDTPGVIGSDGWYELVSDIGRVGARAREEHGGLRLALLAHSMGSFAAQQFVLDSSDAIDALALTGTAAVDLRPAPKGDAPIDLTALNAAFRPARTDYDWLTRDDDQVDRYVADPLCGFGIDAAGARAMYEGALRLADPGRVKGIRSDLPVYAAVGDADPVNAHLTLVHPLIERLRTAGLTDVTLRVYEGARHKVLIETNRAQVLAELVAWLDQEVTC